jgi:hypothetical protein
MRDPVTDWQLFVERKLSVPFDILDAATEEYLSIRKSGRVLEFSRRILTLGSVIYEMCNADFGDLGNIKLRKLNDHETELTIDYPPIPPTRDLTLAELTHLDSLPETERRQARGDLHNKILHEKTMFMHYQSQHFRAICDGYLKCVEELDGGKTLKDRIILEEASSAAEDGQKVQITVGSSDVVGQNKYVAGNSIFHAGPGATQIINIQPTPAIASMEEVTRLFTTLNTAIDSRPKTGAETKADLKAEVKELQTHVEEKSDTPDEGFIARRLRNIGRMAPEILDVMITTAGNPVSGLLLIIKKSAEKAKELAGKS